MFSIAIVCSMVDVQFGNEGGGKERLNLSVGVGFGWRVFFLVHRSCVRAHVLQHSLKHDEFIA